MKRNVKIRFILCLCLAGCLLLLSVFASALAPHSPYETNAAAMHMPPCLEYLFGTDKFGRCILSRVLAGTRTSIFCTVGLVFGTFTVGTALGMLCGYYGGILDACVMRFADVLLSLPEMVLAIAVAGILGGGMGGAMAALGFAGWVSYARLAKSRTLVEKKEEYICVAKMGGCSDLHIMVFHILPNIMGTMLVNAALKIGTTLLGFAGLSFLGLGVQAPQAEWGSMISEARAYLQAAPWAVFFPGAAIVVTVVIFNLLGDAARDLLDVEGRHE